MMGAARFKIKYQLADLHPGPGVTTGVIGQLKKGAVVDVIEDANDYYYKVRLDNGIEGYLYKPSGELTNLPRTTLPDLSRETVSSYNSVTAMSENGNGAVEPGTLPTNGRNGNGARMPINRVSVSNGRAPSTNGRKNGNGSSNGLEGRRVSGSGLPATSLNVVVTSAEIAVFDSPGIVGRQVAKLRRGERVALLNQDSFFYQVQLPNGISGYIPRYAAENQ